MISTEALISPEYGRPLAGICVIETGGGVAGGWCGRLFADLGAEVTRLEPVYRDRLRMRQEEPDAPETQGLLRAWLDAGKIVSTGLDLDDCDVLIVGEDHRGPVPQSSARRAVIDISWFGRSGPYANWNGTDLAVQALSGMIYPCGPVEGPPQFLGDIQSAVVGGVTAFIAGMAAMVTDPTDGQRVFEVSILEAFMVLAELQTADAEQLGRPVTREGVNRFYPTCPLGIHRCKEGWLGVTVITAAQWEMFCEILDLPELAVDPDYATIGLRSNHVEILERVIDDRLARRTAQEWAEIGREKRVPMVAVPDAEGILHHPVFTARGSLAPVRANGQDLMGPRSPVPVSSPSGDGGKYRLFGAQGAPLAGLRIADFSMGWAGPLATRLMADLGAEVIKIEAGRYPDWWRATEWSPEAIAQKQYEESRRFAALNRGKKSVSLDLTSSEGLEMAHLLATSCDVVIENQAAGVMARLGLSFDDLSRTRPDLVMLSMSAYGSGHEWSNMRAYGSTLEQGSGLPRFRGAPGDPPAMAHIAYGDPVGGIYGAASILAALRHRQEKGTGQWINLSQIECMLPFAAPAILSRVATGREPTRRLNGHVDMAPHGIYPAAGQDNWVAIAVEGPAGWAALAQILGRMDWLGGAFDDPSVRRSHAEEIDAVIGDWTRMRDATETAVLLQQAGVIAAPVLTPEASFADAHLLARNFFHEVERDHVGRQRQAGTAITEGMVRYRVRRPAPYLGGDSRQVLVDTLGVEETVFAAMVEKGVISLTPTELRR